MTWEILLFGFAAGLLISVVTTPVGVSGAVFLLPVQLSLLGVPSPAVTPTNLMFNVVAGPGALLRYRHAGGLAGPLTRLLLIGTLPGVILGAVIRVFAVPGPRMFRLIVAAVLLPLGLWLCIRAVRPVPPCSPRAAPSSPFSSRAAGSSSSRAAGSSSSRAAAPSSSRAAAPFSPRTIVGLAVAAGTVGGIYGIGGGSLLGPVLAGRGMPIAQVAPAVLASTFLTSVAGAATYGLLALTTPGDIAPEWLLGLCCGLGGLAGGYLGARLQPSLPETALRLLLGGLATALAVLYLLQAADLIG